MTLCEHKGLTQFWKFSLQYLQKNRFINQGQWLAIATIDFVL